MQAARRKKKTPESFFASLRQTHFSFCPKDSLNPEAAIYDNDTNRMESVWTTNLLWIANPLCLTFGQYCFCTLVKFCAETLLDFVVVVPLYAVDYKKLPSRVPVPIMKGLERLEVKDYVCLFLNSFVSFNFLGHLGI